MRCLNGTKVKLRVCNHSFQVSLFQEFINIILISPLSGKRLRHAKIPKHRFFYILPFVYAERERQNSIPVIAQTWWKELLHNCFFLDTKPFVIFYGCVISREFVLLKLWFNCFFFCSGMKLEFLFSKIYRLYLISGVLFLDVKK